MGGKGGRWLAAAVIAVLLLGTVAAVLAANKAGAGRKQTMPVPAEAARTPEPLPLTGWVILVDPGHGGYDGGARARISGIWEKHINLAVALEVEKSLAARGASVVMTRREDEDLCEAERPASLTKKRQDMENRVAIAVANHADMVLSIHMNEYRDSRESGPQVFYRQGADAGRLLAGCLQEALIAQLAPARERQAMAGDYFILQLEVPSALVECGFISNAAEEKLLLTPAYQAKLAEAIAEGAAAYAALRPKDANVP
ncbi:MAG: N-acetylmuramoyl-L-alanine amidase [Eubacteriales bacterium]|nr:N-acetylmuramoyl-L-alanine amidase [Eubacteriales bacterium]